MRLKNRFQKFEFIPTTLKTKNPLNGVVIKRRTGGFGDQLMASYYVHMLRSNHINAVLDSPVSHLCQCPSYDPNAHKHYSTYDCEFRWGHPDNDSIQPLGNFMDRFIVNFNKNFHTNAKRVFKKNYIPVKFKEDKKVESFDVVICSNTKPYIPYRKWSRFPQLKKLLKKMNISYKDITDTRDYECLTYIKRSKVYLGLETGMSHYVSQYANGKGVIIQSGYCNPNHWSIYDYEFIQNHTSCEYCYKRSGCENNHECMNISPERVLSVLERYIKR